MLKNNIFLSKVLRILIYLFLGVYAICSIYPLFWMGFNSLKNNEEIFALNPYGLPTQFRFENYAKAWNEFDVVTYFKNSTIVALAVVFLTLLVSLMFSYAIARMNWKLSNAVKNYVTLGMFIPVQIILIPLVIVLRDLHVGNSLLSVIIPYTAFQIPFMSIIMVGYLRSLPFEMEESASIDGASIYRIFFQIILPLVKPAIVTCGIFTMLFSWNEFIIALVVIGKQSLNTLPIGLVKFQGQFTTDWGAMAASLTIASIPTIIIYLLFSRQVENAMTVGSAVKG